MFAVCIYDVEASENKVIKMIVTSPEVARVLIDLSEEDYPILSEITFIDEELYNEEQLISVKEDVSKLYGEINNDSQKLFLKEILELVTLAESLNLWVLFSPFYES